MAPTSTSQNAAKAVMIMLLLMGGEVAAMRTKTQEGRAHTGSHGSDEELRATGGPKALTGGSDVCRMRDLSSPEKAVARYHEKMHSLKGLATKLSSDKCSKGCLSKWSELKGRMNKFGPCSAMVENETSPPELLEAITTGPDSIQEGLMSANEALTKAIKNAKIFPAFEDLPGCMFQPTQLNATTAKQSADSQSTIREQLFGADCDEASATTYVSRLRGPQLKIARNVLEQVDLLMQLQKTKAEAEDSADDDSEKAEAEMEAGDIIGDIIGKAQESVAIAEEENEKLDANALLEVDEETAGFWKLQNVLILILCFIVGVIIIAFIVSFVTTGGLAGVGAALTWPFVSLWNLGAVGGAAAGR